MDDYKILLPVTGNADLVRTKLEKDIPDLTKLILVNNFDDEDVYDLCIRARDRGATLYYHPENLGLAASWNLGMKAMMEAQDTFVVILSASAQFNHPLERFIDQLFTAEAVQKRHRYIASSLATLHCFAVTPLAVEEVGYFDENFYPIYVEDTDWCYRCSLLRERGAEIYTQTFNDPADLVVSRGFSLAVTGNKRLGLQYQMNMPRMGDYWARKWSGAIGAGMWKHPFNNCTLPLSYWNKESNFIALPPKESTQPWNK